MILVDPSQRKLRQDLTWQPSRLSYFILTVTVSSTSHLMVMRMISINKLTPVHHYILFWTSSYRRNLGLPVRQKNLTFLVKRYYLRSTKLRDSLGVADSFTPLCSNLFTRTDAQRPYLTTADAFEDLINAIKPALSM
jgi:hypothetical protein